MGTFGKWCWILGLRVIHGGARDIAQLHRHLHGMVLSSIPITPPKNCHLWFCALDNIINPLFEFA